MGKEGLRACLLCCAAGASLSVEAERQRRQQWWIMASDSVVVPAPALPPRRAGMEPGACKRTLKPSGLSVVVLASDLAVDEDEFGLNESPSNSSCRSSTGSESSTVDFGDDDFLDLEELEFMRIGGVDKEGRQIVRVVGKFLPGR